MAENIRLAWLKRRQEGIGGSDVAAILGLRPFADATPLKVYLSKTEPVDASNAEETERMQWGKLIEPLIIKQYSHRTGIGLEGTPKTPYGMVSHPEYPQLLATPDQYLEGGGILEVKNTSMSREWGSTEIDASESVPLHYYLQVLHYLDVTQRSWADIAVLIAGGDCRIYKVEDNPSYRLEIRERLLTWWDTYVVPRVPPPCETVGDVKGRWPFEEPDKVVQASESDLLLLEEYRQAKAHSGAASKETKELEARLREALADGEIMVEGDRALYSCKSTRPRRTVDTKKLKDEFPVVYEKVVRESEGTRRFTVH